MESYKAVSHRIPALLWESLQDLCFKQDRQFVQDVSRIIGVPVDDIRKRVLGVRGTKTAVLVEEGPYWAKKQCCGMVHEDVFWKRCGFVSEANGFCWTHQDPAPLRYDDPSFATLPTLSPYRLEGAVVWVRKDGTVYTETGDVLKDWTIDISNGRANYRICMESARTESVDESPGEEAEAEAEEAEADAEDESQESENEDE